MFLDDQRKRSDVSFPSQYETLPTLVAKNHKEFVSIVEKNGLPTVVSFDMDLHPDHYKIGARSRFTSLAGYENCLEPTGLDAAKFLVGYCRKNKLKLPTYFCHSMNPAGKTAILKVLNSFVD